MYIEESWSFAFRSNCVAFLCPPPPLSLLLFPSLSQNIRSPQVRQALASLQSAIAGDSFNSVIANFNLDTSDAAVMEAMNRGDGIAAFLEAIMKKNEDKKD